ncbi:MAG: AraC family transcriptional regulator [Polaromonas sp.]|nr:AraC family transcriptional regulator [Polaromonas sp.]
MALPQSSPPVLSPASQLVHELLPSASCHVALALVHVPGPAHHIEPQPYYRITFNIGPSYGVEASCERFSRSMEFTRHALMVIPPGMDFAHQATHPQPAGRRSKPGRLATFRISRELFSESAMALGLSYRHAQLEHKIVATDEVLRMMAQVLLADLRAGSPDGAAATERAAMALVGRLLLREHRDQPASADGPMARVRAHIAANLPGTLTLEQLADVAGMSLFHFCRVFRDSLGETPHQYILARRMEQAQRFLWARNGTSMLEIALACGFGSSSHFSAQFKRHTGQTPLQWQRSH